MQSLTIEKTDYTPQIVLDPDNQKFQFIGQSFPENTFAFYKPVIEWLKEYFKVPRQCTIDMDLKYLNSSSLKSFFDIFEVLDRSVATQGSKIKIRWIYDEENDIALETGENMNEDFNHVALEFVTKSDDA